MTPDEIAAKYDQLDVLDAEVQAARAKLPTPRFRIGQPDTADPADVAAYVRAQEAYNALRAELALLEADRLGRGVEGD